MNTQAEAASASGTATMLSAVVARPGCIELAALPLPEPGPGEVRIRIEGCGVCGSNQPVWEGREWFEYPQPPGSPGHEAWGVVDAVGGGVRGLGPGNRVAVLSYRGFATHDVARACDVVRLPASLAGVPFPAEPLGCALNVFRRSDIRAGHTVAIVGIGFLGALLTQLAARAGARVIAISRRACALDVARASGAEATLALTDAGAVRERVLELTSGRGCERVLEAVGHQATLDLATELTQERGRLIIAGFHQDGPRQVNMFLWNWRGLDVINAHERDPQVYVEGMRAAVAAVENGVLDPRPLFTHSFPLEQLGAALELMQRRPPGFIKALVRP